MIYLIWGEDQTQARFFLDSLKQPKGSTELAELDLKTARPEFLYQNLTSAPLFYSKRLVVVENFFQVRAKINPALIHPQVILVILERTKKRKVDLSLQGTSFKEITFKLEKLIFRFLDNLYPANFKVALPLLAKILPNHDPALVFYQILAHFRRLMLAKGDGWGQGKVENLADWQIEKYQRLAAKFSQQKLEKAYKALFELEVGFKTGKADLADNLPQVILQLTK